MGAEGEKYSPSLVAMSPTCSQNGTSGCRPMMSRTASNSPWMSPSAPISMRSRGGIGGTVGTGRMARRAGRAEAAGLDQRVVPVLPIQPIQPILPLTARGRRRHQQLRLVPDEVVFAVDRQLVVFAHEDGADRARFFAVAAEDAARLVNLVDGGVARARLDGPVVFGRFEI